MKTVMTVLAIAALCICAWAADNPAVGIRPTAVRQSPVAGRQSLDAITIPSMLSYQGKLTDTSGLPVVDTTYSVDFRLYTVPTGGSSFWNETQTVRTRGGLFSTLLGSVAQIDSVPSSGNLYLGMAVAGGAELSPRLRLVGSAYSYLAGRSANTDLLQGKDTSALDARYVNEGQSAAGDLAGTYPNPTIAQKGAGSGQVLKWTGSAWQPRNDSVGGGGGDNAWVRVGGDSVLYTLHRLGIARGGAGNVLLGSNAATHVNFGVGCTTGTSTPGFDTCCYTVGGGKNNAAVGLYSTVSGGLGNRAWGDVAAIGGGEGNSCASNSVVAGGVDNATTTSWATVGGGRYDTASSNYATVVGGRENHASGTGSTVGGMYNSATGMNATVPGGRSCTASGDYSFATNQSSDAPNSNAAAFNGTTTNASNQTSVSVLKQGFGTFACDHPLDPDGRILNQYVAGSNEAIMTYRGVAVIGSGGKVEAQLPDYFDALNRNPMIQLTGVGSSDVVYVAEEEANNRFAIGGKPGMKVFWTVTGERKDPTAEIGRLLQPVEMAKTGSLRGVSLDDEGLVGVMDQLEQMGKAGEFSFRTAAGRQRYEAMKRMLVEEHSK